MSDAPAVPAADTTGAPVTAVMMGGIPSTNRSLLHAIRFEVGDPVAVIEMPTAGGTRERLLIIRDIEMARARERARAHRVACPADFTPQDGLSGDRAIATAQAAAEACVRAGVQRVVADRTLPMIFVHELARRQIQVGCNPDLGVIERRSKDASEVEALRRAQFVTEEAMRHACMLVGNATADAEGVLHHGDRVLSSELVRSTVDAFLLTRNFDPCGPIVAGGTDGGDCHAKGAGPLRTGEPVIIDIYPRDRNTGYHGDCTRTVVHGEVPETIRAMHEAVVAAKAKATEATRAGATGEDVHRATLAALESRGYAVGLPAEGDADDRIAITHGTGHGIGLDVHEPPLLDIGGPELVVGDALTIEPGLYAPAIGGVRVEDLVIVTEDGCKNLNALPEGLTWTG